MHSSLRLHNGPIRRFKLRDLYRRINVKRMSVGKKNRTGQWARLRYNSVGDNGRGRMYTSPCQYKNRVSTRPARGSKQFVSIEFAQRPEQDAGEFVSDVSEKDLSTRSR